MTGKYNHYCLKLHKIEDGQNLYMPAEYDVYVFAYVLYVLFSFLQGKEAAE